MPKKTDFTIALDAKLKFAFLQAIDVGQRPASDVIADLMLVYWSFASMSTMTTTTCAPKLKQAERASELGKEYLTSESKPSK